MNHYVIADIHGQYDHLMKLVKKVRREGGLNFKRGDVLVQLGDRCDRGPDTYRVNNFFYKLWKRYPNQIICLNGNHEQMLLDALLKDDYGNWNSFLMNGGFSTMDSYKSHQTTFLYKLQDCGHIQWMSSQPYYYETKDYFFSHAPIPLEDYRRPSAIDFRSDRNTLTWSYEGNNVHGWVDPDPTREGKLCFHGHIHGIHYEKEDYWSDEENRLVKVFCLQVPGIREVGNSHLMDTGCGCAEEGYLTCIELPSKRIFSTEEKE